MGKRTKGQDRDKYYHLAKDQGYRARSAFKLIEINKKYDFLSSSKVCIDLCAAPGGWCQVAVKFMPRSSIILGVDLLPIRPIPNVKTLVHDITTEECRTALKREMQTWKADVVLCDGAPNVGTAYKKDAYEQNEIALHALKVATQHLRKGGTFVTKVYRSQDYNSLLWVIQQFFDEHQAVKPASSRSQSAEIFVVGRHYKAPDYIDPRMLDPRHAFRQDYEAEGRQKSLSIFHKKYEQHNKRQRQGYADDLGVTLSRVAKVSAFVDVEDPVRMLTDTHVLEFGPECEVYKDHRATTDEIKQLCADLRVLGKGDFRQLIKWRLRMVAYREELQALEGGSDDEGDGGNREADEEATAVPLTEEEKEEEVQAEIRSLQLKALAERKRQRKKEREAAARLRSRVAMGMENHAVDLPEEEGMFALTTIKSGGQLEAVRDVDLSKVDASEVEAVSISAEGDTDDAESDEDLDSDEENAELQAQLDEAYLRFLQSKDSHRMEGTRLAKRTKKFKAAKAAEEEMQDTMLYDGEQQRYLQLLANGGEEEMGVDASDIDSSDVASSDDIRSGSEEESDDDAPRLLATKRRRPAVTEATTAVVTSSKERNPLLAEIASKSERRQSAAQRWFSDPLFEVVDDAADEAEVVTDMDVDDESESSDRKQPKRSKREKNAPSRRGVRENAAEASSDGGQSDNLGLEGSAAERVLNSIPKTDKEKRKEKRKKATERRERKEKKNSKRLSEDGIAGDDLQIVSGERELDSLDTKERAKLEKKRELIRSGMGTTVADEPEGSGFEIAKASKVAMTMLGRGTSSKPSFAVDGLGIADDRQYGSDEEPYDDEDRAKQLALGTIMLRKHRAKDLVDAAYNRFSWNDDADLPDWFVDDEKRHHRPQVPLPPALVEQMKNKFMSLATKPIKKVSEARARKRKRAAQRLSNAKKKATALAANPDMSEREKLKAVQQAMKKGAKADVPSKVYVVAGKGPTGPKKKGAKIKMVDARMKSDTRGMKRSNDKQRMGKPPKKKKGKGRQGRH